MTATDELRRLLDERGVKWGNIRRDGSESNFLTEWQFDGNKGNVVAIEWAIGGELNVEIHRYHLTPAQAIEATLGRGTCQGVMTDCYDGLLPPFTVHCSVCGDEWGFTPNYCPNCGRKVMDK